MLAFKEWSYIVDALGKGRQNLILRKGGIEEDAGDFTVKGRKFLLFPTLFHQAEEMIKADWLPLLDGNRFYPKQDSVIIEYYAEVADTKIISDKNILDKLNAHHAWKEHVIEERFNRWGQNVHLIIVQVFKLNEPFELPLLPQYGGCKSWIEIEKEITLAGTPVINPNII